MELPTQLLIAALSGGIVTKFIEGGLKWIGMISGSRQALRDDAMERIDHLQQRVDNLEKKLRSEVWTRIKAEAMLMRTIDSHNAMRKERDLEPLSYEDIEEEVFDPREYANPNIDGR